MSISEIKEWTVALIVASVILGAIGILAAMIICFH
jgi:hypothetical protein